ncbi:protein phosphatase 1, regulatory subunit [Coemansia sp. RSA 2611]|nr:protein phosphatase 1, regulatory subunit [Coemansia sp. RSA 2611]
MLSPRAAPRFVHFGSDSKQVRWFYKSEPSMNAASDPDFNDPVHTSCTAIMTPIRKPAPMFSHYEASPVVLETVEFADQTLCGTIKVHNLAFEKQVFVRMTTDEWKTAEDIPAAFQRSITGVDSNCPGVDRFRFAIPVPAADHAAFISLCVCYRVNGQEFWDNHRGANYLFKIAPPVAPAIAQVVSAAGCIGSSPDRDAVETCPTSSTCSYGFSAPVSQARLPLAAAGPSVSNADAHRYMQYSEAKFSSVGAASYPAYSSSISKLQSELASMYDGLPLFQASQWSSSYMFGDAQSADFCRALSPLRASSPIMCAGSPLAASHAWATCSATPLHC